MTAKERAALRRWEKLKRDISNSTDIDPSLSSAELEKMRMDLEKDEVAWIKYIFPKYAKYEFADFQIRAIKRLVMNDEWYEVLSWSRELAKSTITIFVVMYLVLTGKKKNILLISDCLDNAERLLAPYRANFEVNGRIKALYGEQVNPGDWTTTEFITRGGASFRAIGAGQSPRGSRNDEVRPDVVLCDDFDTDKECRNPDIIDAKWKWFEEALYFVRSMSEPTLYIWCGNIIAEDCCITRAGAIADHWDVINIRMVDIRKPDPIADMTYGKSVWPQKNSEEQIDRVLSKVSSRASILKECFNCPIIEGKIFPPDKWGKVNLRKFRFLVIYGDPTQSEQKGTAKNKKGSRKAVWLVGKLGETLYAIKGFIGKATSREFIEWYYALYLYVAGRVPVYAYIENNSLQDPFYEQVFKKHVADVRREKGIGFTISPDAEKKTDKAVRIEANLEPLARNGNLVLNEAEKDDPNMQELSNEFKFFTLGLKYPADGIDTLEGALRIIEQKENQLQPLASDVVSGGRNRERYRR